ncbi:CiaD-like domain-containing protein [Campylobacter californiensis]
MVNKNMKLDDIARMAIDEVSAELEKIENMTKVEEEQNLSSSKEDEAQEDIALQKVDEPKESAKEIIGSEEIFLRNLKERIEVLFEGLNEMSQKDLPQRLELTLKFLEFVLANVENRLENLSK